MKLLNPFFIPAMNHGLIIGFCLVISTVVANQPFDFLPGENFEECVHRAHEFMHNSTDCLGIVFSEEELNETSRIHGKTDCLRCLHICRKKSQIIHCMNLDTEPLMEISTKSRTMVPFMLQLLESFLMGLCDDNGILPASNGDDKQCFRKSWVDCKDHVDFMENYEMSILCDSANADTDPYTMQHVCQKVWDHYECMERSIKKCSPELVSTLDVLKNKIRNSEACIKYY